ncbi:hypothetical protein BAUCODRAFT_373455 [Baudoinia panamericana UAMH 10762]|uniref:Uncharacterized protein n=1 Tax=Baudoinia panamericana (strain UAMH 10762) TaxID=717646 RepID=M2NLF6_BAUPA|nr:uncharacterized protein BAUCODRAFT_373455 [Baudoinia panamericana UAMH 10762]EMD00320.1 hypothetical protein BAUCODRAFT_373455 [Baudoinia panamericana UAMH 10762]
MAATYELKRPDDVAEKVLRRAQVSKMTRALQDRLALANVKIQNGWENMSLDVIEPQVEARMRRKRPASSNDTISDTASTASSRVPSSSGFASSPLTAPLFSDDLPGSGSARSSNKRVRPLEIHRTASSNALPGNNRRPRLSARSASASWKRLHSLPESSPVNHTKHARFPSSNTTTTTNTNTNTNNHFTHHLSFISESSTIPDSPPSPAHSEDDDADLPVHSFHLNASTRITSSPPQTPPQDRRMRKAHTISWSRTPKHGEEGADLLMFLATSPSPAKSSQTKTVIQPPSTPPCKPTPLPSSHMTPSTSGAGFLGFGPTTPSASNFNFADFVNVTPSPAQGAWARTPVAGRTPAAAREARRRLNFDSLVPPTNNSSSPVLTRVGSGSGSGRGEGLGMELGGELVS